MKHVEKHRLPYTPSQIFDLVVDVDKYPDFVPWVIAAKVLRREGTTMWSALTMGTSILNKRFTTVASLDRPHRVEIVSRDPIFECFEQVWTFEPAGGGTDIEYRVDIRLNSRILQALIASSIADRASTMVRAFMRRGRYLYGSSQAPLEVTSPRLDRS
jgi:coenzyme Q-binding protein COQ10